MISASCCTTNDEAAGKELHVYRHGRINVSQQSVHCFAGASTNFFTDDLLLAVVISVY